RHAQWPTTSSSCRSPDNQTFDDECGRAKANRRSAAQEMGCAQRRIGTCNDSTAQAPAKVEPGRQGSDRGRAEKAVGGKTGFVTDTGSWYKIHEEADGQEGGLDRAGAESPCRPENAGWPVGMVARAWLRSAHRLIRLATRQRSRSFRD